MAVGVDDTDTQGTEDSRFLDVELVVSGWWAGASGAASLGAASLGAALLWVLALVSLS